MDLGVYIDADVTMRTQVTNTARACFAALRKSSDAQRINLTFVSHNLVANFVRYISAEYYLNWFSFHTVINVKTAVYTQVNGE